MVTDLCPHAHKMSTVRDPKFFEKSDSDPDLNKK
jgi:hypothetical protein